MVRFYRAAQGEFSPGAIIVPTAKAGGPELYVCLATSVSQAAYWAYAREMDRQRVCILAIDVDDDIVVEDCPGHYHFEYPGKLVPAREIDFDAHRQHRDGEVNIFGVVRVASIVDVDVALEIQKVELAIQAEFAAERARWENRCPSVRTI